MLKASRADARAGVRLAHSELTEAGTKVIDIGLDLKHSKFELVGTQRAHACVGRVCGE